MEIEKIIVVTRATRLEESIQRFNTKAQAKFFIRSRGQSFEDYEKESSNYEKAKDHVLHGIPRDIKVQMIDRRYLTNFVFGPKDLIITIGQDGLVVNTAKYLNGQPIIAVNPDPERFDGILLPFLEKEIPKAVNSVVSNKFNTKKITMARIDLNDGQHLYAFNDFFIGAKSHTSARYTLIHGTVKERQSSSGIIVSTPAGSTGWLSSLFNMAKGIAGYKGNRVEMGDNRLGWEEKKLIFVVREPFQSKWSGAEVVAGEILSNDELVIESHMPESGVIFSDGMEADYLEFNSGSTAKIKIAEKKTILVIK